MKRWAHLLNVKRVLVLVSMALLTNCTLYQKLNAPRLAIPDQFKYSPAGQTQIFPIQWWKNFGDSQLNHLVQIALKNNNNYLIALKNIQIAQTYVSQNYSALFPQFTLNYGASRQKTPSPFVNAPVVSEVSSQQLNASVAYQLDVWNQLGNGVKQARATVAAAAAQSKIIKIALVNSVITTYFQVLTLHDNLLNLQQQSQAAKEAVVLDESRFKAGLIDASILDDAKTQLENIKTNISNTQKQMVTFQNTLAYLLGQYPENFALTWHNHITTIPYQNFVPKNLSSKLIVNRPDIQAAYEQVMAAGYGEKQAVANFLPSFNLTGNYGYASNSLSNVIGSGNIAWALGLAVAQPLLDFGQRQSEYERAKLQYQSAIISYKDAALNAFQQIDSALVAYQKDHQALRSLGNITVNAKDKSRLALAQYQAGLGDYASFITNQLTALQSENNYINQRLAVITDVAQVYQTLGF